MKAPAPANETERLRVLHEYHVLDTDHERSFDELAALAANLCETRAAMITFVDESRQWFKAAHGWTFTETHRDLSFCAHAIMESGVLVIPDATKDPRFADNSLVTGAPYIRFYAGAPLTSPDGFAVGTLAVIDFEPRQLSPRHTAGLQILTRQVVARLELRRRAAQSQKRSATADVDLEAAAERHRALFDSALQWSAQQYLRQRGALTSLIQDERLYHGELVEALRSITKTVATTQDIARVSIWRYLEDQSVIRCLDLYEAATDQHSAGAELSADLVPAYFEAMRQGAVIAADDAQYDPRTCEFAPGYLVPLGITSMLDARIHLHGALHGVLCLEHVGAARTWTPDEQTFAVAVANLVSLAMEGEQRRRAQDELIAKTEILTAVSESLAAYVERGDWKRAFSRLLQCALTVTGSEYGFVGIVVDGPALRVIAHEGIVWDRVLNREFYDSALREYDDRGYLTFPNLKNLFGHAITTGEIVIANDPARDRRSSGRPAGHPPMDSFLGVPIRGRDEVTGVIALANRPGGYGPAESNRIEALVRQAGGLCDNYRQRERARVQDEERQRVEEALRASDERLRIVSRATNDAVWDWDLETNALSMPDGFEKLFGPGGDASPATLEAWREHIHPDDLETVDQSLTAAFESDAQRWSAEYRFRRGDGSYAVIFDRGYILRDPAGRAIRMIGAMMDVSERRQLEAQFRQSQKLEAVGQLAGGVAHDFNNILTIIDGHASMLLSDSARSTQERASLREISDAVGRAAGLTRQLLAFSRKQVLQTADVDMNAVVGNMMRLLQRILGEHIALSLESSATPAFVLADPSMMEQVIMNLAINARDAMPGGGRLSLRTSVEVVGPAAVANHPDARAGSFVIISISDTGTGIPATVLPHVFEPFFTTKGGERGTGLGLATVHGVVKQHQGWVTVRSVANHGTTFDVYLPAVAARSTSGLETAPGESSRGGGETVLLVEDEAAVRSLARLILERRGYHVIEAETGRSALALWQQQHGRIDLVLTDMVMPEGISGMDLAAQMLSDEPRLGVIVTSGYSVDLANKDFALIERISFLQKPYSPEQLARAVRAALDDAGARRRPPVT